MLIMTETAHAWQSENPECKSKMRTERHLFSQVDHYPPGLSKHMIVYKSKYRGLKLLVSLSFCWKMMAYKTE